MIMKQYFGIIKLVCLLIVAPVIIWNLSVKDTLSLYRQNKEVKSLSSSLNMQAVDPKQNITLQTETDPFISNGLILAAISDSLKKERVEIMGYTPTAIDTESNQTLYRGELVLAGRYINLVRIIDFIERSDMPVKVSSLSFEYDRKKRSAEKVILLTAALYQIEKSD